MPMLQRGVTLAFLRRIVSELAALGRADIDAGQFCNGVHTTSGKTDYKEFDRSRDGYSGKACALHTGTSFVETCMKVGLTHYPKTGEPYFGTMNTFIWWVSDVAPSSPYTLRRPLTCTRPPSSRRTRTPHRSAIKRSVSPQYRLSSTIKIALFLATSHREAPR